MNKCIQENGSDWIWKTVANQVILLSFFKHLLWRRLVYIKTMDLNILHILDSYLTEFYIKLFKCPFKM